MRQYRLNELNRIADTANAEELDNGLSYCQDSSCGVEGCQENQKTAAAIKQGATFVLASEAKKLQIDVDSKADIIRNVTQTVDHLREVDKRQVEELRVLRADNFTLKHRVRQLSIELSNERLHPKYLAPGSVIPLGSQPMILVNAVSPMEPIQKRDPLYGCPVIVQIDGLPVDGVVGRNYSRNTVEITVESLSAILQKKAQIEAQHAEQRQSIREYQTQTREDNKTIDTLRSTVVSKNQRVIDLEQTNIQASRKISDLYAEIRGCTATDTVRETLRKVASALHVKEGEDIVSVAHRADMDAWVANYVARTVKAQRGFVTGAVERLVARNEQLEKANLTYAGTQMNDANTIGTLKTALQAVVDHAWKYFGAPAKATKAAEWDVCFDALYEVNALARKALNTLK